MENPTGGHGAARGPLWVHLLPALLFLGLALLSFRSIPPQAPWLTAAQERATLMEVRGTGLLEDIAPVTDPRTLPAIVALHLGLGVAWIAGIATALGLLLGGGTIFALSRFGARIGAYFLAVAPIWIEGALGGDPGLLLGCVFLLLARRALPLWGEALLLGWTLGWSPWAWIGLILVPILRSAASRYRGLATLALALALLWITNPPALMNATGWGAAMLRQAELVGVGRSEAGIGLQAGLWPLWGTIHIAGLALLLIAVLEWPRRIRAGDAVPLALLLPLILALRIDFATQRPLLLILPFVAAEIERGFALLVSHVGRLRGTRVAVVIVGLLLLPALVTVLARRDVRRGRDAEPAEIVAWLEGHLAPGSLVVHDIDFAPPEQGDLIWLAIPFHAVDPNIYRDAYWTGWYRGAAAFVISERLVVRYLRAGERGRAPLDLYGALVEGRIEEVSFGEQVGRRMRILRAPPHGNEPLGTGWRERIARGRAGGLTGDFLASLGRALSEAGWPGSAVAVLEEALTAGFTDLGVYINLANAQLDLGRTMEAGRVLDEAARKYPDSPELRYNLALVLTQAELWDRAIRTLARLQNDWPRSAQVAYLLGVSLANEDRPDAALAQLERALELDPDLPQRAEVKQLLELLRGTGP